MLYVFRIIVMVLGFFLGMVVASFLSAVVPIEMVQATVTFGLMVFSIFWLATTLIITACVAVAATMLEPFIFGRTRGERLTKGL